MERGSTIFLKPDAPINTSTSIKFSTFVGVSEYPIPAETPNSSLSMFSNISAIGVGLESKTYDLEKSTREYLVGRSYIGTSFMSAISIDKDDHENVIESLRMFNKRFDKHDLRLVDFEMTISLNEISLQEENYQNVVKWNAMKKLSVEEVEALGLVDSYVHLKLLFGS